ncbi:putative ABC transporter substrate-binding protein [Oscillibacter valericigenes Sjm18-20]|nr:putative ABC transporter substrate-binding protein [Oscillibacter valericigenes Sjm18-20]
MKKVLTFALAAAMTLSLAACGAPSAGKPYKIGLLQYGQHASLDNCREGFLQGLEDAGLVEGTDYTVDYQNAGFDNAMDTQIAGKFSSEDVDMMVGVATPSAVACYTAAEEKNIPVIYVAVSDPAAAGLDSGNITGTSDALPVDAQLQLIRAMQPDAKTIGILYTTSEPNSVSTIAEYQEKAGSYGFTIDAVGVTTPAEVPQGADTLISHKVDCFSNLTDNNVVGVLPSILEKTSEAGIPVYGSEIEQVKIGCAASAGIDYVQLGKQTGAMAAKVIRGEATCDQIPFETIDSYSTYINSDVLDAMGISVPSDIAANAVEASAAA